jgi:hypothetical protein
MDEDPYLLIVKSIGIPSFDIILSWYLVAILLPAGWYVREIHGWNNRSTMSITEQQIGA